MSSSESFSYEEEPEDFVEAILANVLTDDQYHALNGTSGPIRYRTLCAKEICDKICRLRPEFHLRAETLIAILLVDLEHLNPGGMLSPDVCLSVDLKNALEIISPFCKHYMLHLDPENIKPIDPAVGVEHPTNLNRSRWAHAIPQTPEEQEPLDTEIFQRLHSGKIDSEAIARSIIYHTSFKTQIADSTFPESIGNEEEEKCKDRDQKCILTGRPHPDVFWFIPRGWNDTVDHNNATGNLESACLYLTNIDLLDIHSASELRKTHRVWNMVCIDKIICDLLKQGLCAFRFIGKEAVNNGKVTVQLQFFWMPTLYGKFNETVDSDDTLGLTRYAYGLIFEFKTKEHRRLYQNNFYNITTESGQELKSGYHVYIEIPEEDVERFESAVKIQWACILFTTLCGGAGRAWYLTGMDQRDESLQPRDEEFFGLDETSIFRGERDMDEEVG
ncbi:hypothetical protein ACHAPO_006240 [Fusarium lateritium]